ncbi:MAG TPA: ArsR family transcriptional regulator [Myxococcota bacterium]|nr:ArsR family transcriptional regulator [Myxococcota bacterium]HQK51716.1 ArsR family transcriptional regulator [Myxococcota bacterium]
MKTRETCSQEARVLKALANESRLLVIDRPQEGEASAGERVALVGTDASTDSWHLTFLRANGIVADRRDGATAYDRLLTPCGREGPSSDRRGAGLAAVV